MNLTVIIICAVILVILLIVIKSFSQRFTDFVIKRRHPSKSEPKDRYEWKTLSGRALTELLNHSPKMWSQYPGESLYYLSKANNSETGEQFGVFTLDDGFELTLEPSSSYSELIVIAYPSFRRVLTIPYPEKVHQRVPEDLPYGSYFFILRTHGEYLMKDSHRTFKRSHPQFPITQHYRSIVNKSDEGFYDNVGKIYTRVVDPYLADDYQLETSLISTSSSIYPESDLIHFEELNLELNPEDVGIVIIPNRNKTLNCPDLVLFDERPADIDLQEEFNVFEILGNETQRLRIRQIIYGSSATNLLPMYAYIHKR